MEFKTQFEVDLEKYAGLWFEADRTPNKFQDNTPRRNGKRFSPCYNTTAEYTLKDGEIELLNNCYRESDDGDVIKTSARGLAVVSEGSGGRKLKIAFGPTIARFFQRLVSGGGFDYWIYRLGPVNGRNQYDWAVISGPKRDFIFVLTRDRLISDDLRAEILACAREEGLPVDDLLYRQRSD